MSERLLDNRSLMLSWGLLAVLVLGAMAYVEQRYVQNRLTEQRAQITERLSVVRYQLEGTLADNLSLINGLAAFIASYPDFTRSQFDLYASTVLAREPALVNLAVAPGLVVQYVYPLQGNEAALGLDYMLQNSQRDVVMRIVETGAMVIAGPVQLVQGGVAFIGRAPVYVQGADGQSELWGIVSSPMLVDSIYQAAGLLDESPALAIAIRGNDAEGSNSAFFGSDQVFTHPAVVSMPVSAGGSTWELAAAPAASLDAGGGILMLRAGGLVLFALLSVLLLFRDRQIANNKALRGIIFRNERFLRAVETVSKVGGWRWSDNVFSELSSQTRQIMALPEDQVSMSMPEFCHSLDTRSSETVSRLIINALNQRRRLDEELELRRREGEVVWLNLKADLLDHEGQRPELIGAIQDITQQKLADQLIEYQANYDTLTRLPNRGLFKDRLQTELRHARRRSTRLAVLFVDLDNFKSVNDNLGHDAGDELLIESARRIQACVRSVDTVARYSGDEFVAILVDVFSADVASRIAEQMVLAMRKPFSLDDRQLYCSVSIGVSFYPDDGNNPDTLVIKADQTMYEVKKSGRNAWQFYTAEMQQESEHKHRLFNELVAAIESDRMQIFYQPVVDAQTGVIESCEALVRWRREDGSWVSPDIFIPVAEERGLINRIDLFVLRQSLKFVRGLNALLATPIRLSVNVSPRLLYMRDDDAQVWLRTLEQEKAVGVTIEITERVLLEDSGNTSELLEQLHRAGVKIAIDDFGTGYSGLSYFARFPVSAIKIDRSFVRNLGQSKTETTLVETILLLAQKLGIVVVAEGVESEAQAEFLRARHCDYLQGYHISPPLSDSEFSEFALRR
jgi:diguanylate cyclase (GGDEF)-like protein/PAS domain S-box-containing protein